jgi:hypothetical protein
LIGGTPVWGQKYTNKMEDVLAAAVRQKHPKIEYKKLPMLQRKALGGLESSGATTKGDLTTIESEPRWPTMAHEYGHGVATGTGQDAPNNPLYGSTKDTLFQEALANRHARNLLPAINEQLGRFGLGASAPSAKAYMEYARPQSEVYKLEHLTDAIKASREGKLKLEEIPAQFRRAIQPTLEDMKLYGKSPMMTRTVGRLNQIPDLKPLGIGLGIGMPALMGGKRLLGGPPDSEVKAAFFDQIKDVWSGLDEKNKLLAAAGGATALAGGLTSLVGDTHGAGPLLGLGGAAAGLYGMSGGDVHNILPMLKRLFTAKTMTGTPTTTHPAMRDFSTAATENTPIAQVPGFAKYFNPDGTVRFKDVINTPDAELQQLAAGLHPTVKKQLLSHLQGFEPSWGQRLGAKAIGIDIEGQKQRLSAILGEKQADEKSKVDPALLLTGGGAAALGGSALSAGLEKINPLSPSYDKVLADYVRKTRASSAKLDWPAMAAAHANYGSRAMAEPAWYKRPGLDAIKGLWNSRIVKRIGKMMDMEPPEWGPWATEHYGNFASGPIKATLQMQSELPRHLAEHAKLHMGSIEQNLLDVAKRQGHNVTSMEALHALPRLEQENLVSHFFRNTAHGRHLGENFISDSGALAGYPIVARAAAAPFRGMRYLSKALGAARPLALPLIALGSGLGALNYFKGDQA